MPDEHDDGLPDEFEVSRLVISNAQVVFTDPENPDCDNNHLLDGQEITSDDPRITVKEDLESQETYTCVVLNYCSDPNREDTDGDGLYDGKVRKKEYALKVHDYVACKVTYDPMGYDPKNMMGQTGYETCQEAYNVLGKNQKTAVCAGYARAFALICQSAGINCAWVWGNETEESSHAWNVIYPCDGSEPVLVDVTWDDGQSLDFVGQTEVEQAYFYIPLSSEYEHMAEKNMEEFSQYINETAHG